MAKKKNTVEISLEDLHDMIWMSYRYCCGRKSIASQCHAATIATYIKHISEERREFMATDLRKEISMGLHFKDGFRVEGYSEKSDAISVFLKYMCDNGLTLDNNKELFQNNTFTIDTTYGTVYVDPIPEGKEKPSYYSWFSSDMDTYTVWIRLANFMDKKLHKTVTFTDPDTREEKTLEIFPWYDIDCRDGKPRLKWSSCDSYLQNPHQEWYIADELVKDLKFEL